jgi:hypothetical protein
MIDGRSPCYLRGMQTDKFILLKSSFLMQDEHKERIHHNQDRWHFLRNDIKSENTLGLKRS